MPAAFGGHSMVTPLKNVLIRPPDQYFCVTDPKKWHYTATPDLANARREHAKFATLLESLGVEISYHDRPLPALSDSIYVYDPALITDHGALILRMGKVLRRGEESAIADRFNQLGIPIIGVLTEPAMAEGGDMFWIDHKTLAIGIGFRTNPAGVGQIQDILRPYGIALITADLPYYQGPDACLHLLSLISLIDEQLAVVYRPLFPVPLYQYLKSAGFDFVDVPDEEFLTMGPNILTIKPRVCIMLEGNPVTKKRLEERGCRVHTYRGNDISLKAEGGPTCLTRPLLRIL